MRGSDTFVDLVERVAAEYYGACEHADASFLETQSPKPGYAANPSLNWQYRGSSSLCPLAVEGAPTDLVVSPISFVPPTIRQLSIDWEPTVVFFESKDEVEGNIYFPMDRFSVSSMERFGRGFMLCLRQLLVHPAARVCDVALSD
jgi:hypothetical protein